MPRAHVGSPAPRFPPSCCRLPPHRDQTGTRSGPSSHRSSPCRSSPTKSRSHGNHPGSPGRSSKSKATAQRSKHPHLTQSTQPTPSPTPSCVMRPAHMLSSQTCTSPLVTASPPGYDSSTRPVGPQSVCVPGNTRAPGARVCSVRPELLVTPRRALPVLSSHVHCSLSGRSLSPQLDSKGTTTPRSSAPPTALGGGLTDAVGFCPLCCGS